MIDVGSSMTTEWRVRWDRTDQRIGPNSTKEFANCADAETFAREMRERDEDGIDGIPIGNPLTFGPVIERRVVSAWVNWAEPTGTPVPTIDRVTWDEDEWYGWVPLAADTASSADATRMLLDATRRAEMDVCAECLGAPELEAGRDDPDDDELLDLLDHHDPAVEWRRWSFDRLAECTCKTTEGSCGDVRGDE